MTKLEQFLSTLHAITAGHDDVHQLDTLFGLFESLVEARQNAVAAERERLARVFEKIDETEWIDDWSFSSIARRIRSGE